MYVRRIHTGVYTIINTIPYKVWILKLSIVCLFRYSRFKKYPLLEINHYINLVNGKQTMMARQNFDGDFRAASYNRIERYYSEQAARIMKRLFP